VYSYIHSHYIVHWCVHVTWCRPTHGRTQYLWYYYCAWWCIGGGGGVGVLGPSVLITNYCPDMLCLEEVVIVM
jgi:hypothetical protein